MYKVYQFNLLSKVSEKPYKISLKILGQVVEDVRTVFEERNDVSLYIPTFRFTESVNI